MAAFIKGLNAKIRSNPTTNYICSTRTLLRYRFISSILFGGEG